MSPIQIYTTNYCGYCVAAKRLLTKKGLDFEELDVTDDPERRHWLVEATGARTVPQVFVYGRPLGGYQELSAAERSGQLDAWLAAGAPGDSAESGAITSE